MSTKNVAIELKSQGVWVVGIHPGTTDTGLSKPFQKNVKPEQLFTVEFSVDKMLGIIDAMEVTHTGGYYAWDGKRIEW